MKHSLRLMDKKRLIDKVNSTVYSKSMFNVYLNRLNNSIDREKCKDPYLGLRIAEIRFKEPYPRCADYELIALAVMRLLMMYVYNTEFAYGKFTIGYNMKISTGEVSYTIGKAISLNDDSGNAFPNKGVYAMILLYCKQKAEEYKEALLSGVFIRVYLVGMKKKEIQLPLSSDEMNDQIWQLINAGIGVGEPQEAKAMDTGRKRRYPDHIPSLKPTSKERRPFIVADTETVLINDVHVPYAAGFLVVNPDEDVGAKPDYSIETYFSEDHMFVIP